MATGKRCALLDDVSKAVCRKRHEKFEAALFNPNVGQGKATWEGIAGKKCLLKRQEEHLAGKAKSLPRSPCQECSLRS